MKKIIALVLVIMLAFSMTGCDVVSNVISGIVGGAHVHEFVVVENQGKPATCLAGGVQVKICSCGETVEENVDPLGHSFSVTMEVKPDCLRHGSIDYRCDNCGKLEFETVLPLGHNYEESSSEPSRVIRCTNEGCVSCKWEESEGKFTETLTFNFTKDDEAALDAKYNELLTLINDAPEYDPTLHGYVEEGALADEYEALSNVYTEYYDLLLSAVAQRQIAEVTYYCNMNNEDAKNTYTYMMDYYTSIIAKLSALDTPLYDSCYREFYYYGLTQEEIDIFLLEAKALSNPEYVALKERNNAIEAEIVGLNIKELTKGDTVPRLYEEFAANNNAMAKMMGYENYLEYAYELEYSREYTYQEAVEISEYVKEYIAPLLPDIYKFYYYMSQGTDAEKDEFKAQMEYSFFENLAGNTTLNDYIDLLAFTSNADKNISFSDEFNNLMSDGNMFRGQYGGAYVTTIVGKNIPIAYFGNGYNHAFTIAHEFGHYMNELYNNSYTDLSQSYDLLEMHSQGNELLYLYYLEPYMNELPYNRVKALELLNILYIAVAGMTIDTFEQAIYLNEYDGKNADVIMADGKITYDEYDLLYHGILADFGVAKENFDSGIGDVLGTYWRMGMTVTSPCYYISYSVSAISVLQIYEMAETEGFDAAKDAYLKLFTYTDESLDMTLEEILEYAGLLSFKDEQLYINLNKTMKMK